MLVELLALDVEDVMVANVDEELVLECCMFITGTELVVPVIHLQRQQRLVGVQC